MKTTSFLHRINQIVRLKQVMGRWKSHSSHHRTPSGSVPVYVGPERCRFVIPTRFLNLPLFVTLLEKAEEEYGYRSSGGIMLPCDVVLFEAVLGYLERDEHKFGRFGLDQFLGLLDPGYFEDPSTCRAHEAFTEAPLLPKLMTIY